MVQVTKLKYRLLTIKLENLVKIAKIQNIKYLYKISEDREVPFNAGYTKTIKFSNVTYV